MNTGSLASQIKKKKHIGLIRQLTQCNPNSKQNFNFEIALSGC